VQTDDDRDERQQAGDEERAAHDPEATRRALNKR
jgi:hypothetical protein